MEIRVHTIRVALEPEQVERLHRQVERAFERFRHSVRSVDLRVVDINGPRGGLDKRASVELVFHESIADIHVTQTATDAVEAVDLVLDRARRAMVRRLDRSRRIRHRSIRDVAIVWGSL